MSLRSTCSLYSLHVCAKGVAGNKCRCGDVRLLTRNMGNMTRVQFLSLYRSSSPRPSAIAASLHFLMWM